MKGKSVLIRTDNKFCLYYLLNMGGNGRGEQRVMTDITREIYAWGIMNGTRIVTAEWIPSARNVIPDSLSRLVDHGNWRVADWVFQKAENLWGPHTIDRMAASSNTKCARFNSWVACRGAEAVNCFTQEWGTDNNWVAPPLGAIGQVINFILEVGATATLLVPMLVFFLNIF